jgi:hypothetical protein
VALPAAVQFRNSWNQTAAWAQSRGISYSDYYPVYQSDSQRLLKGQNVMSQAEREREIAGAANIKVAPQAVPSTTPAATNVIGNTITDLRNIFTGLGDVVIHPLHNGLVDQLVNTIGFIDGHYHPQGATDIAKLGDLLTNTVAAWVPGLSDVGTVLQAKDPIAGLEQLAEHPVTSLLDVSALVRPFAFLSDERALQLADTFGFKDASGMPSVELMRKATAGRAAKHFILSQPVPQLFGEETARGINGAGTKLVERRTLGDIWEHVKARSLFGANQATGDLSSNVVNKENFGVKDLQWLTNDVRHWVDMFDKDGVMMEKLADVMDPKAEGQWRDRADAVAVDFPYVREAAYALDKLRSQVSQMALVWGHHLVVRDPVSGSGWVVSALTHPEVETARDALQAMTTQVIKSEVLGKFLNDVEGLHKANEQLPRTLMDVVRLQEGARRIKYGPRDNAPKTLHGAKKPESINKGRAATKVIGKGGMVDQILELAHAKKWDEVALATRPDRLDLMFNGWHRFGVDASEQRGYAELRNELLNLHHHATNAVEDRDNINNVIHGKFQSLTEEKKALAAEKAQRVSSIKDEASLEKSEITRETREQIDRSHATWVRARKMARSRASQAKKNAEKAIKKQHMGHIRTNRKLRDLRVRNEVARIRQELPGRTEQEVDRARNAHADLTAELVTPLAERMAAEIAAAKAAIDADLENQLARMNFRESDAEARLKAKKDEALKQVDEKYKAKTDALDEEFLGKQALHGKLADMLIQWNKAREEFLTEITKHPPDVGVDPFYKIMAENLMEYERGGKKPGKDFLKRVEGTLVDRYGYDREALRQNPVFLTQLAVMALEGSFAHFDFAPVDREIVLKAMESAKDEIRRLVSEGHVLEWMPRITSLNVSEDAVGRSAISMIVGKGIPDPDFSLGRGYGSLNVSRFDPMAGIMRATRQMIERDANIEFVNEFVAGHAMTTEEVGNWMLKHYKPEMEAAMKAGSESPGDLLAAKMRDMGMLVVKPNQLFGFTLPRWGKNDLYMDRDLVRALEKIRDSRLQPSHQGIFETGTKLFRYSILGLSPRFTAHIMFGGTFLLALRSSPMMFRFLPEAIKMLKDGTAPEALWTESTNLGTLEYQLRQFNYAGGETAGTLLKQAHIEGRQGVKLADANPLHWAKAAADLNLKFTRYVTNLQRAVAYLDAAAKAEKIDGMDPERAAYEGMKHATEVMGDLRRMSPLEKQVARTFVPFYGWTKHILQYVLTFPADHPWRAMMLSQIAEYDNEHGNQGLPSRFKFLFFLGTPDAQGNVTSVDLRALNPLRDVANYASWGGLVASLNPILTTPVTQIDPQAIYGETPLYPNLTYDQFYGIETAPAQGNLMTAIEGVVPQAGAIGDAIQLAAGRHSMSTEQLTKNLANSLNFPWWPERINLRAEAGRTSAARYEVAKQLSTEAWQSGDFSSIANLGQVPDPRNPDYEINVSDLEQLYKGLATQYPGQAPSEVAQPLPTLHL